MVPNGLRRAFGHDCRQGVHIRFPDGLDGSEALAQFFFPLGAYAGDAVQRGTQGAFAVALVVESDGETVRFLLNLANERKDCLCIYDADFPSVRSHQRPRAVAVVFHHAEDGNGHAKFLGDGHRRLGVGNAAVDEEHVRKRQKFFVPVRRPLEPPPENFPHGGVIVGVSG